MVRLYFVTQMLWQFNKLVDSNAQVQYFVFVNHFTLYLSMLLVRSLFRCTCFTCGFLFAQPKTRHIYLFISIQIPTNIYISKRFSDKSIDMLRSVRCARHNREYENDVSHRHSYNLYYNKTFIIITQFINRIRCDLLYGKTCAQQHQTSHIQSQIQNNRLFANAFGVATDNEDRT